jgi:serine O-acetyltransferase
MQTSLSSEKLYMYLSKQIVNNFPDDIIYENLNNIVKNALQKVEYCFSFVNLKHYYKDNILYFNHLNSDQYTVFIYYASNIAYEKYNDEALASKLFYLNKILNQFHCMYNTKLPDIFILIHSTGIVLGKANYSDFMVVSHHCTVGANSNLEYPKIKKFLIMYPYSSITGASNIGQKVCLSNSTFINDNNIDDNKIVFERSPKLSIKHDTKKRLNYFFRDIGEANAE